MKIISLSALLVFICFYGHGQNLVGFNHKEIREYMKVNCTEMNYNSVVNNKYSYLKYSDNQDEQTMIFFLDHDSVCRNMRMVCAKGLKPQKIKEFDTLYIKSGEDEWTERRDGKEFLIKVLDEKWSFIVTIEQKK